MNCRQLEEKITLYCEGLLESDELWAAQEHLRNCEACRKLAEEMSELLALIAEIPEEPIPEGFDERLSAALAVEGARIRAEQAAASAKPRKRKPWRVACAAAACFIICFAVVAMAQDGQLSLPSDMVQGGASAPEAGYDSGMVIADSAAAPAPSPEAAPEAAAPEAPAGAPDAGQDSCVSASGTPIYYNANVYNRLSSVSDRGFSPKVMAEADAATVLMMDDLVLAMNNGDAEAFHYSLFWPADDAEMKGDTLHTYHEAASIQESVNCLNDLVSILGAGTVAYERVGGLLTVDGITYRLYTLEEETEVDIPAAEPEEDNIENDVKEDLSAEVHAIVRWTSEGLMVEFVPQTTEEEVDDGQTTGNH